MSDGLKLYMAYAARARGICAEGYERLQSAADTAALVDYYIENPDWCMERSFPSLKVLRDHFADIGDKGVFVDRTFHGEVLNDLQTYIFHHCKGTIRVGLNVDKAIIPMLYIANGCRLRIVGVGEVRGMDAMKGVGRPVNVKPTMVPVYVFGKNDLSARDNKFVEFNVYKHGLL